MAAARAAWPPLIEDNHAQQRALLEVEIVSGRKHQIRRHPAGIRFPVVGDRLYDNNEDTVDLQLTADSLAFVCPVSEQQKFYQLDETLLPQL